MHDARHDGLKKKDEILLIYLILCKKKGILNI